MRRSTIRFISWGENASNQKRRPTRMVHIIHAKHNKLPRRFLSLFFWIGLCDEERLLRGGLFERSRKLWVLSSLNLVRDRQRDNLHVRKFGYGSSKRREETSAPNSSQCRPYFGSSTRLVEDSGMTEPCVQSVAEIKLWRREMQGRDDCPFAERPIFDIHSRQAGIHVSIAAWRDWV